MRYINMVFNTYIRASLIEEATVKVLVYSGSFTVGCQDNRSSQKITFIGIYLKYILGCFETDGGCLGF